MKSIQACRTLNTLNTIIVNNNLDNIDEEYKHDTEEDRNKMRTLIREQQATFKSNRAQTPQASGTLNICYAEYLNI